jgi:hypothetical protein
MRYEFKNTLIVDTPAGNKKFSAGDVIDGDDILAGCLASCLANKALVEVPDEGTAAESAAEPATGDAPAAEKPAPASKKRNKK